MVPVVLLTMALTSTSLVDEPKVTFPEPPAVTAAPIVSVPVVVSWRLPLATVVTTPVVVMSPVFETTMFPPASVIPATVSEPVLTRTRSPLVLFDP